MITSLEQRIELLRDTGVDAVVVLEFDEVAASEEAEDFINRVFVDCLASSEIIVGEDFHFGRGRRGNVEMLSRMGKEHDFVVTPLSLRTTETSEIISSTAIRAALRRGDLDGASNMLGRTVAISGHVVHGDERGRTIGFPTANVDVDERFILPADGVYAAWCHTEAGVGTLAQSTSENVRRFTAMPIGRSSSVISSISQETCTTKCSPSSLRQGCVMSSDLMVLRR